MDLKAQILLVMDTSFMLSLFSLVLMAMFAAI